MNARQIIEQETLGPYDVDDPLEKPEIPTGFNAKREDGDEIEWRFDPRIKGYRFTKWWNDPHTRKREVLRDVATQFARDNPAFVNQTAQEFQDAGWTVTML